jgi:hypothetical protein
MDNPDKSARSGKMPSGPPGSAPEGRKRKAGGGAEAPTPSKKRLTRMDMG